MRLRWLPILAPAVLGLILSLILNKTNVTNPILYLRADLGTLILIMGVSLTVLAAVAMLLIDWVERQRLKNFLEAADERRRFLRRLDHELKNPLTAIMAGLANVSAATNKERRQDGLESVQAQVRRLSQLVAELRKLSDLEIRELDLTPVDIGELLQEVLALAEDQPESKDRQISLSVPQVPWPLPKIMADRDLLFLAVHNLFDNALKFTQSGARVEVRAQEDGAHVRLQLVGQLARPPQELERYRQDPPVYLFCDDPYWAWCVYHGPKSCPIDADSRKCPRRPSHHRCTWSPGRTGVPGAASHGRSGPSAWRRCSPRDGPGRWPRRSR